MGVRADLQARERAAVADVVASTLRHDLRNKLASVRNASFYLMRKMQKTDAWSSDARVEAFFQLIDRELAAAEEVLTRRAPVASSERPLCHAGEAAERALLEARVPEHVKVERDFRARGSVPLDVEDLALLMRCLVDNAVESMPRGGLLTVRTWDVDEGEGGVSLRVEDVGEGLAPEAYSRAFEPFYSTRPGHAGLGLNIVQRLVLRNGGKVALDGGPSGGTHVEIHFPNRPEAGGRKRTAVQEEIWGSK
ncbi:sensor histidine kinase [Myxococcus stipitatus DSM 14675]|uniref:histidine kinase n=1 Tax=Myxococcus stipitatus (strain DSM 14675 / JCM 12634 / Mx s8) TaxID=1278073 RepID=L7TZ85_MYXSD|nr:sensor histidine kinase [Myxococcus stipitatus]AGC41831.1 sensor histidine kinase [Myxococcus stipitatus DSM 14675]